MAWENRPNPNKYVKNWASIRRRVLDAAGWKCVVQYKECVVSATEVDHIDRNTENNDLTNLRAVCVECHKAITLKNNLDSRNILDPRPAGVHPAELVDDVEKRVEAIKEREKKKAQDVDDVPTDDETQWVTTFGPVFEKLSNGKFKMPKKTLGIHVIKWMMENLMMNGEAYKPTKEQARIILWMYAIDDAGEWLYNKTLHIAPKGWGKDPFGAVILAAELCSPAVRFSHFDEKGNIITKRVKNAWCQIAAVSTIQNENTMRFLKNAFRPEAVRRYKIEFQVETIYAYDRESKIESVSASSSSKEGNQISYVHISETQHWTASNGCHKLFRVLTHNLAKVDHSRFYMATNAYSPNDDSIAQRVFESWEESQAGIVKNTRLLVVAKMATVKAPTETMEQRLKVLNAVYGSSTAYTNVKNFAEMFDDKSNDPSDLKRFFFNTVGIESTAFLDVRLWDKCKHPDFDPNVGLPRGTRLVLALDCSKSNDSTALVGMVVQGKFQGMLTVFGVWEKPSRKKAAEEWIVPREEVDTVVAQVFKDYSVQGFWCDPSHKMDENGGGSYWMPLITEFHRRYSKRIPLFMWAKGSEHATNWDMTSHANQKVFVDNLAAFEQMVIDKQIYHDGSPDLRRHLSNARRFKSKMFGNTIKKESSSSDKKIDLAVTSIICLSMYNKLLNNRKTRTTNLRGYTVPQERAN